MGIYPCGLIQGQIIKPPTEALNHRNRLLLSYSFQPLKKEISLNVMILIEIYVIRYDITDITESC